MHGRGHPKTESGGLYGKKGGMRYERGNRLRSLAKKGGKLGRKGRSTMIMKGSHK